MKKLEKIKNIEFLRFLFTIMIVYGHIFYWNIARYKLYTGFSLYETFWDRCTATFFCVEYFFIIAGFFLFFHFKNKQESTLEFAINKIIRLWPLLALSIAALWILSMFHLCDFHSYQNVINLLLLNDSIIKIRAADNEHSWFVSVIFWCFILFHYLYHILDKKVFNALLAVLVFCAYTCILNFHEFPVYYLQAKVFNFISGGMVRGIGAIGLGYFLGMLWDNISNPINQFEIKNKLKSAIFFTAISALEIYLIMFIINNSIFHKLSFSNPVIFIINFCILLLLFLAKKGLLSKLLENNISVFLGKFSFAIYIMQGVGFAIEKHFMWTNKAFVCAHPYINIWASILICVAIGVVSHIFVEKKAVKAFNALIAKTRSASGLSGGGVVFAARKSLYNLRLISPCSA